jgi:hypothetical protein
MPKSGSLGQAGQKFLKRVGIVPPRNDTAEGLLIGGKRPADRFKQKPEIIFRNRSVREGVWTPASCYKFVNRIISRGFLSDIMVSPNSEPHYTIGPIAMFFIKATLFDAL